VRHKQQQVHVALQRNKNVVAVATTEASFVQHCHKQHQTITRGKPLQIKVKKENVKKNIYI